MLEALQYGHCEGVLDHKLDVDSQRALWRWRDLHLLESSSPDLVASLVGPEELCRPIGEVEHGGSHLSRRKFQLSEITPDKAVEELLVGLPEAVC